MKINEAKAMAKSDPNIKLLNLKTRVEVTTTALHPKGAGKTSKVPEHMIPHLVKKGMIEDPGKVKRSKEKE
jgi:hypothetical protein